MFYIIERHPGLGNLHLHQAENYNDQPMDYLLSLYRDMLAEVKVGGLELRVITEGEEFEFVTRNPANEVSEVRAFRVVYTEPAPLNFDELTDVIESWLHEGGRDNFLAAADMCQNGVLEARLTAGDEIVFYPRTSPNYQEN